MQLPAPRSQERIWEQVQVCIHVSVFLRLRGSQLPISIFMYEVSGSKPRTASHRGLVESFMEAPVIGLAIEISRPLLSHPLEIDTPTDQFQQHN